MLRLLLHPLRQCCKTGGMEKAGAGYKTNGGGITAQKAGFFLLFKWPVQPWLLRFPNLHQPFCPSSDFTDGQSGVGPHDCHYNEWELKLDVISHQCSWSMTAITEGL
ncbi:hypothetical protein XELAEV_18016745mg [Xenopus laevis]|uniref:Uncharacterized protein n=1 Tax=Xenopus laevis TaxID=8355 RepID=A0A974DCF8_XENLA|nr:hypothetical protein XELAEV_18016745mg [Xenopus laevis]